MKKLLLALLGLFFFSLTTQAQIIWQKTYGASNAFETAYCMTKMKSGGYTLAGFKRHINTVTTYVVRTDENGDTLWTRSYGIRGFTFCAVNSICEDTDGNLIMTGSGNSGNPSNTNAFLLKLKPNGDSLWSQSVATPQIDSYGRVTIGNDSSYIISLITSGVSKLLKISKSGSIIWNQNIPFSLADQGGVAAVLRAPGGYLAFVASNYQTAQMKVAQLDEAGNQFSQKVNLVYPISNIFRDFTNNIVIASGNRLHKLNFLGDTIWSRSYKIGSRYFSALYAASTDDGNYLLQGEVYNGFDYDLAFMKVDTAGTVLKDTILTRYGANELAKGVAISPQGDYVLAGYTDTAPNNSADMISLKYGKWAVGGQVGVAESLNKTQFALQVYPNPTKDLVTIQSEKPISGAITVYNLQAQKVLEKNVEQMNNVNLSITDLHSGVYLLQYISKEGYLQSQKIIKE